MIASNCSCCSTGRSPNAALTAAWNCGQYVSRCLLPCSVRLMTELRPSTGFGARETRPSETSAATSDVIRRWVMFSALGQVSEGDGRGQESLALAAPGQDPAELDGVEFVAGAALPPCPGTPRRPGEG